MSYFSQLPTILGIFARNGSQMNPNVTTAIIRRVREGEIGFAAQTRSHGALSRDCHEYIGEFLLWEDLFGPVPFPGLKPDELKEFEDNNPRARTGDRYTLQVDVFEDTTDGVLASISDGDVSLIALERHNEAQHTGQEDRAISRDFQKGSGLLHDHMPSSLHPISPRSKHQYEDVNILERVKQVTQTQVSNDIINAPRRSRQIISPQRAERRTFVQPLQSSRGEVSVVWGNPQAQQENESFRNAISNRNWDDMMYSRRAGIDWPAPSLGYGSHTGLPKYAVVMVGDDVYSSLSGTHGSYLKAFKSELPNNIWIEYLWFRKLKTLIIWPDLRHFYVDRLTYDDRVQDLEKFLCEWAREVEQGYNVPINKSWVEWQNTLIRRVKKPSTYKNAIVHWDLLNLPSTTSRPSHQIESTSALYQSFSDHGRKVAQSEVREPQNKPSSRETHLREVFPKVSTPFKSSEQISARQEDDRSHEVTSTHKATKRKRGDQEAEEDSGTSDTGTRKKRTQTEDRSKDKATSFDEQEHVKRREQLADERGGRRDRRRDLDY